MERAGQPPTTGGEIYYSRNAGDSWELLAAHLPTVMSLEAALVP